MRVYESPELLTSDIAHIEADDLFAGDVWALAVILHELLTKTMPFDWSTEFAKMNLTHSKQSSGDSMINLTSPLWHQGGISRECREFITKALFKDPRKRIRSVKHALSHPWLANQTVKL